MKKKTADKIIGSYIFILCQTVFLICYILYQIYSGTPFDSYPFILLNLGLSMEAAFTAPLILIAHNKEAEEDRKRTEYIYQTIKKMESKLLTEIKEIEND